MIYFIPLLVLITDGISSSANNCEPSSTVTTQRILRYYLGLRPKTCSVSSESRQGVMSWYRTTSLTRATKIPRPSTSGSFVESCYLISPQQPFS
ncbi:hypothetical protein BDV41DRAFT_517429 [Aspergillus transmontanensis]|uniref:Secreted protein n=1 Tax=Aspergillus transmontanensis TaxID=1034304 RepID=A0A5N6WL99_9EURO|nr:hypothetical protein BDV41DRAFT_517429 [Aspergillus transmontanensis]